MENTRKNNSHDQDKKKTKNMGIKIGGSGGVNVGGVVLLGGALAAATFLGSAFLIKTTRRRSDSTHNKNTSSNNNNPPAPAPELPLDTPTGVKLEKNQIRKGVTFILPSSSSNETAEIDVDQIESKSPFSTQNFILDEKPKIKSNGVPAINPREPKSSPLFDESEISKEECSAPVFNNISPVKPEDVKENGLSQEIQVTRNLGEAIEADNGIQSTVKDITNRPDLGVQEEEKECESDGKIIVEKRGNEVEEAELIKELESCENGDVEKEHENDGNIIVEKREDGLEGANVGVETPLIEEQESPTNGDQEAFCPIEASEVKLRQDCSLPMFDNPTNSEPESQNKNEDKQSDEEFEVEHEDNLMIEEETPQMQLNEEQEVLRTGNKEVICSDSSIPRINTCEVKRQVCLTEVCDNTEGFLSEDMSSKGEDEDLVATVAIKDTPHPEGFQSENMSSKEEDEVLATTVAIKDTPQLQSAKEEEEEKEDEYVGEIIVDKCVVVETAHSDGIHVDDDEKIQVDEDQETLVNQEKFLADNTVVENCYLEKSEIKVDAESSEQLDSTEDSMITEVVKETEDDAIEEDPPKQLMKEEQKDDSGDRYIAVEADTGAMNDNSQIQFSEEEKEGDDNDKQGEANDDADDEDEVGDMDDEDTCEKAEENSEGTGNSSMESNTEAIWPAEESLQEEYPMKFRELKINNNSPGEKIEENGKFNGDDYKISEVQSKLATWYNKEVATMDDRSSLDTWKLRVLIVSILVPLVLLLPLLHVLKPSFH